jgi:hypothetical protein
MEQAPGPRGSPHEPHGLVVSEAKAEPDPPFELTAKTDNCFSRSWPAQAGQAGDRPSRVRNSKRWPQPRHAYSNKGMLYILQR